CGLVLVCANIGMAQRAAKQNARMGSFPKVGNTDLPRDAHFMMFPPCGRLRIEVLRVQTTWPNEWLVSTYVQVVDSDISPKGRSGGPKGPGSRDWPNHTFASGKLT